MPPPEGRHRRAINPSSPAQHRTRSLCYQATSCVRGTPHFPKVISWTPMFRATSAIERCPSMTNLTASSLYSPVKLRRVAPIRETPEEWGSYHLCPPDRGRFIMRPSVGQLVEVHRLAVAGA